MFVFVVPSAHSGAFYISLTRYKNVPNLRPECAEGFKKTIQNSRAQYLNHEGQAGDDLFIHCCIKHKPEGAAFEGKYMIDMN